LFIIVIAFFVYFSSPLTYPAKAFAHAARASPRSSVHPMSGLVTGPHFTAATAFEVLSALVYTPYLSLSVSNFSYAAVQGCALLESCVLTKSSWDLETTKPGCCHVDGANEPDGEGSASTSGSENKKIVKESIADKDESCQEDLKSTSAMEDRPCLY